MQLFRFSSKHGADFVLVINDEDYKHENEVLLNIGLAEGSSGLESVVDEDDVLHEDDANQDWDLELDAVIFKHDCVACRLSVEQPGDTCTASHLENLWSVCLSQSDLLVRQLLLEDLQRESEIIKLLLVTDRDTERIQEHR